MISSQPPPWRPARRRRAAARHCWRRRRHHAGPHTRARVRLPAAAPGRCPAPAAPAQPPARTGPAPARNVRAMQPAGQYGRGCTGQSTSSVQRSAHASCYEVFALWADQISDRDREVLHVQDSSPRASGALDGQESLAFRSSGQEEAACCAPEPGRAPQAASGRPLAMRKSTPASAAMRPPRPPAAPAARRSPLRRVTARGSQHALWQPASEDQR